MLSAPSISVENEAYSTRDKGIMVIIEIALGVAIGLFLLI